MMMGVTDHLRVYSTQMLHGAALAAQTLSMPTACEPWPGNRKAMGVSGATAVAGVGTTDGMVSTCTVTFCFLRRAALSLCRSSLSRLFFSTSAQTSDSAVWTAAEACLLLVWH